ncbi:hypothetical protein OGATHE_002552 [Ogataea polymorpha]|uniref:Uncharacterized protein n=1 Tax=Ogataea polymorpha TaxID=460523 RepID=A0A9P8T8Z1_9ASCO|nr:hypothetical protein OGATHE_002552 [Ogataea polymorpha]
MRGHFTSIVVLNEHFQGSLLLIVTDWSVWSNDVVALLGHKFGHHTGSGGQTGFGIRAWQFESEKFGVVRQLPDILQFQVNPLIAAFKGDRSLASN